MRKFVRLGGEIICQAIKLGRNRLGGGMSMDMGQDGLM